MTLIVKTLGITTMLFYWIVYMLGFVWNYWMTNGSSSFISMNLVHTRNLGPHYYMFRTPCVRHHSIVTSDIAGMPQWYDPFLSDCRLIILDGCTPNANDVRIWCLLPWVSLFGWAILLCILPTITRYEWRGQRYYTVVISLCGPPICLNILFRGHLFRVIYIRN